MMGNLDNVLTSITEKSILIPYLVGPHGVGKTSFVKGWAKNKGKSCITLNLSAIESVDLTGMPIIDNGRTVYAKPKFFDYDVLFLDEINRVVDTSTKAALLSLLIDRSINGHEYKGVIIAAGNEGEGYDVQEMDPAFADRLVKIQFKHDLSYLPEDFRKFVESNRLYESLSLRRLTEASKFLNDTEILAYFIGPVAAEAWIRHTKGKLGKGLDELFKDGVPNLSGLEKAKIVEELGRYKKSFNNHMIGFLQDLSAELWMVLINTAVECNNTKVLVEIRKKVVPLLDEERLSIVSKSIELAVRGAIQKGGKNE